ncbi:hypothetical protein [Streptomyces sp. I05A-00742]|uniref:hypothetical protein n=1 Tax=Streptomyces sp. I05A-00742 TaxID=2732853 RepID=UPI001487DC1C|nr:hypothetical protein [Streptomyces sp. I05A-00742]
MNRESSGQDWVKLRELISDYGARGYSVISREDTSSIPSEVRRLRPDLILRKGDETIVVELKGGADSSDHEQAVQLEKLVGVIDRLPNWKLEFHWLGTPPAKRVSREQADEITSRARAVQAVDPGAALLLAWAAAEVTLDQMIQQATADDYDSISERRAVRSPKQLVAMAQSLGLISYDIYEILLVASDARNRIAHGFRIDGDVAALASNLLEALQRILPETYVSPDRMIDWFRQHYEAENMPDDGCENEYRLLRSEPYEARDVLQGQFPDADEKDIDEAVWELESECYEWVSKR